MVVPGAIQWILRRLKTLVRALRASSGLGAFALPTEIILMIASHLNRPSVTCLALTCRTLHSLCFPGDPFLNMMEKEELFLLLEEEVATINFCHHCVNLHRWHSRWSSFISPWYQERMPCKWSRENHLFLSYTSHVPYHYARLVMNQHFYGQAHGPPPSKLGKRARSYQYSDGT
jgi:hypothetical protein